MTTTTATDWPLFELINPSDKITFRASSLIHAGVLVALKCPQFGARSVANVPEATPVMFGWEEWLASHKVTARWVEKHRLALVKSAETFACCSAAKRDEYDAGLAVAAAAELATEYRRDWDDVHRSSMNKICEAFWSILEIRVKAG